MTHLLLEIPRKQDLELLLTLLRRLDVKVIKSSTFPAQPQPENEEDVAFILAGLPEKADFEEYVKAFEESRQDKPLPGREN